MKAMKKKIQGKKEGKKPETLDEIERDLNNLLSALKVKRTPRSLSGSQKSYSSDKARSPREYEFSDRSVQNRTGMAWSSNQRRSEAVMKEHNEWLKRFGMKTRIN